MQHRGSSQSLGMHRPAVRFSFPAVLAFALTHASSSFGEGEKDTPHPPIPAESQQLVLVRSANWVVSSAVMTRYERANGGSWRAVGERVRVHVGKHGMAWGRGLQPLRPGPTKREGDGRTPAGVFRVGSLFGYAAQAPASASPHFSYVHITVGNTCVEDPRSPLYNQIINTGGPASPMLRADGAFRLGFVIEQNTPEVTPGAGSCVFFHVQRGPWLPTSGCTSAPLSEVAGLIDWLKPEREPVIVELPDPEYAELKDAWGLPREPDDSAKPHATTATSPGKTAG